MTKWGKGGGEFSKFSYNIYETRVMLTFLLFLIFLGTTSTGDYTIDLKSRTVVLFGTAQIINQVKNHFGNN